jgi:hypothetical protein
MRRRRLLPVALLAAGSTCLLAGAFTPHATAEAEPGSGFGSFNLAASAPAVQLRLDDPNTCFKSAAGANGCEGVVPEALATLRNGPIGHGLAAVAWPGVLASGAGSLLITLGMGNVPPQATALNDPVRADAYTNVGQPTSTYDLPGTTMTATALPDRVSAEAAVGQVTALPVGTFGRMVSRSSTVLTAASRAVAIAHSEVHDLTIAGVVHIASVVSDATATTDGSRATASGRTTASGISVNGIPVTVGDKGVTVTGTSSPLTPAQDAVNLALSNAGMTMALGAPAGKPVGASAAYNAQSLVLVFTNPTGFTSTVVLGGANVSVVAAPALTFPRPPGTVDQVPPGVTPPGTGVQQPAGGTAVLPGVPAQPEGLVPQVPVTGAPQLTAEHLPIPDGPSTRLVLLTLVGAALLAAGLRQLPDRVLQTTARECLMQESA